MLQKLHTSALIYMEKCITHFEQIQRDQTSNKMMGIKKKKSIVRNMHVGYLRD